MGKVTDFLSKNKTYIMLGIIIFLIVLIFVGGIMIGKGIKAQQELKAEANALKADIKQNELIIKSSSKNAQTLIDSAGIYESFARKQALITGQIHSQTNKIKNETQKSIHDIDGLSRDSNVSLFSKYAQEYIDSSDIPR